MASEDSLTAIIMAKAPQAGAVKRRLIAPGGFDAETASRIAEAMLRCVVRRLAARWPVVVAVSPDDAITTMKKSLDRDDLHYLPQGAGDLGTRMFRAWQTVAPHRPAAFFGMDSPDVPGTALANMPHRIGPGTIAIGPTPDGGYWTLAGRQPHEPVLTHIDWGGPNVYDQSIARAKAAGLTVHALPNWPDVDEPADLAALQRRLAERPGTSAQHDRAVNGRGKSGENPACSDSRRVPIKEDDAALRELAATLDTLVRRQREHEK